MLREIERTVRCKKIEKSYGTICFEIPESEQPYDVIAEDKIVSICTEDIEDVINTFRNSGYSEDEMEKVFGKIERLGLLETLDLPKPVKIKVPYYFRK